ncbi:hypothetical protein GEMRC1_010962 [Eukaryota sp. GEM-RC1]
MFYLSIGILVLHLSLAFAFDSSCFFGSYDLSALSKPNGTAFHTHAGSVFINPCTEIEIHSETPYVQHIKSFCVFQDRHGLLSSCGSSVSFGELSKRQHGVRAIFSDGLECPTSKQILDLSIICYGGSSSIAPEEETFFLDGCNPEGDTVWVVEWLTGSGCPRGKDRHWFVIGLLAVVFSFAAYLGIGVAFNSSFSSKTGLELIPHFDFWVGLKNKIALFFTKCIGKVSGRSSYESV